MIELSHITKRFGEKMVLADFSYTFPGGKTTCVTGPSGSGKTTLLRIAAGLLKPDAGTVRKPAGLRASFVFQEDRLLPWANALANITVLGVPEPSAIRALAEVGLGDELRAMPSELSGGMLRRLAIARALAFGGDLFFLDEPLRGLDAETAAPVLDAMKTALSGKTALLITHNEAEAEALADKMLWLQGN